MVNKGKTYEIFCKRGMNRDNCKYRNKDKELHCSICSFAGFLERNFEKQPSKEEVKTKSQDGQ